MMLSPHNRNFRAFANPTLYYARKINVDLWKVLHVEGEVGFSLEFTLPEFRHRSADHFSHAQRRRKP